MNDTCIITDAWEPQVNGVVTTLKQQVLQLEERGYSVEVIHPGMFKTFGLPTYKEIQVPWNCLAAYRRIAHCIYNSKTVHIATEGMLGYLARLYCHRHDVPYVTSYHTKFPEYVKARAPFIPLSWGYAVMRWMHNRASTTLVTTESMQRELAQHGITGTQVWTRGVDTEQFRPIPVPRSFNLVIGYVGRVAVEKNIEAFLKLPDELGTKVVVGDGPDRERLEAAYPDVNFVGYQFGDKLAEWYSSLDCMVFPSLTDTFGLVNIESMACGTPVAAYPVTGPKDIIVNGVNGYMSIHLEFAVKRAIECSRERCREYTVEHFSWDNTVRPYLSSLFGEDYEDLPVNS